MKISDISSPDNQVLKRIRGLHRRQARDKQKLFLLEGEKVAEEAIQHGLELIDVVVSKSYLADGLPRNVQDHLDKLNVVDDKIFAELTTTTTPTGIIAVAETCNAQISDCLAGQNTLIVIGEAIQDPGNLGTIVRCALAFSATGVILSKGSVDAYNPKVVRSAMGALFALPVVSESDISELLPILADKKIKTVALSARGNQSFWDLDLSGPLALLLGNEGHGLSTEYEERADAVARIPISDKTESLNVAITAAIALANCAKVRS